MSVNAVDQTTGNTTPIAGNTNNLVGNLSALTTNTKSDAVGAINEVNQTKQNATDNNLQTTDKTIVGGINELKSGLINHEIVVDAVNPTDTILYQKCIIINKLVVFSVKISIGATTASGNYIVGGLPKVSTTLGDNVALVACATNAKDISLAVANRADDGAVFSLENIETGKTIVLSGSYITQ